MGQSILERCSIGTSWDSQDGKVAYEHIYWDQALVLAQIGMLDRARLPVAASEQADRLLELIEAHSPSASRN